ncbi:MAG: hypothetical protein ACPGJV_00765 [Bacteriovoracaceae bacterium]
MRTALFLQFWTGCRPNDACKVTLTDTTIVIYASKTESFIQIPRSVEFEILSVIADLAIGKYIPTTLPINKVFNEICQKSINQSSERYNIRHTVLTQRVISERSPTKLIAQEAGHAMIRMIDSNYGNRVVLESKPFEKLMKFKELEVSYRGWFLQECLIAIYPSIKKGISPKCPNYKQVQKLLKEKMKKEVKIERKSLL